VDNGIFLGNNIAQLRQAIKEIQDQALLNIKDRGQQADYVESASRNIVTASMNLLNMR
jgi:hypothetical protein